MPFEPDIVSLEAPPTDDQGELILPPELRQLEQQLSLEARQLAATFPPSAEVRRASPSAQALVRLLVWAGSVSAVVAMILIAGPGPRPATRTPSASVVQSPSEPLRPPVRATGLNESEAASFLRDLSGPELEGLLDLMESGESPSQDVSI